MTDEELCLDITDEVVSALKYATDANDPWQDYIDWKHIRAEGFARVIIQGEVYEFTKWGVKLDLAPKEFRKKLLGDQA